MIRSFIAVSVLVAGLTACGFHLRNKLTLPPDVPALRVTSVAPYSELVKLLNRGVRASGAELAEADAPGGYAHLNVLSERWGDLPIAIDSQGRAQEYSLRYAVIFTMLGQDGSVVVPQQVIELSRDYISNAEDNTGTSNERETLADEMRRDMSASILRRIDSVVRARLNKGEDARQNAAPAPVVPASAGSPN